MVELRVLGAQDLKKLFGHGCSKQLVFSEKLTWRRSYRAEGGYTLVGLLVAVALFTIFSAMAMATLVVMNGTSLSLNRLGVSAEGAQASFLTVSRYLEYAVPPAALSQFSLTTTSCGSSSSSSSAFANTSPSTASTSTAVESVEFCSFGSENSTGLPNLYELEICPNTQPILKLMKLSNSYGSTLLVDQRRVICGNTGDPTSYLAFCTSPPSLSSTNNSQNPPLGCSFTPSKSEDPYVYLSIAIRAVPRSSNGDGSGAAPPTRVARLIKIKNVIGGG